MRALFIGIVVGIAISVLLFGAALQQETGPVPDHSSLASDKVDLDGLEQRAVAPKTDVIDATKEVVGDTESADISIGAAIDPSDALIFSASERIAVIEVGEPLDPEDLSQLGVGYAFSINVGEASEPESPSPFLTQAGEVMVINDGEPGEPAESWLPSLDENHAFVHVGEPLEIDDTSTFSR